MTIDEAIKELRSSKLACEAVEDKKKAKAFGLGIEALIAIKLTREDSRLGRIALLAGETKE